MLPASTSIISFCQPATASTAAKRQREGDRSPTAAPRPPPAHGRKKEMSSGGKKARGEKNLHERGAGNADLAPGRASAWEKRAGASPATTRGLEAVGDAKARSPSAAGSRTPASAPRSVCSVSVLRTTGEASSPLRNTQQRFTTRRHQLSAPALFQTFVLGKFGGFSVPEPFSPFGFWKKRAILYKGYLQ